MNKEKSGKDNNVLTKKTNFEKITIEDMAKLISNINHWAGSYCFMDICFEGKVNSCDECPFVINNYNCDSEVDVREWLESEVE